MIEFYRGHTDARQSRFRGIGNVVDYSKNTSTPVGWVTLSASRTSSCAWISNTLIGLGSNSSIRFNDQGVSCDGTDVVKNNICIEAGSGTCEFFTDIAESIDNQIKTVDPWDRDGVAPGSGMNLNYDDVGITPSNVPLKGKGVVSSCPVDLLDGEAIPQSGDYDAGGCLDDE
jgi:hypothetical protein